MGEELIKGEIADYKFDENGILFSYSKSILRTVENIQSNVDLVKKITGNTPVPMLIHLKKSPVPSKETRQFSTEKLPEIYTAMAMVSESGLAQFIMKIVFALKKPPIPIKSFTNEKDAYNWLLTFK